MKLSVCRSTKGATPGLQLANTRRRLFADRGYDSQANRQVLHARGLQDGIARRARPGQTARMRLNQRNHAINRTRARVEHIFASLAQQGGKCVRAMTLARNLLAVTLQCAAYNARRLVWLLKRAAASAQGQAKNIARWADEPGRCHWMPWFPGCFRASLSERGDPERWTANWWCGGGRGVMPPVVPPVAGTLIGGGSLRRAGAEVPGYLLAAAFTCCATASTSSEV